MKKTEVREWLYKGFYIVHSEHPQLYGKYEVFKDNASQDHLIRCRTLKECGQAIINYYNEYKDSRKSA